MLIVALGFSCFMVLTLAAAYRAGAGPLWAAFIVLGIVSLIAGPVGLIVVVLPPAIVAAVCRSSNTSARKFAIWCAVVATAPYVLFVSMYFPTFQETLALRREYPIESLRVRLAFSLQQSNGDTKVQLPPPDAVGNDRPQVVNAFANESRLAALEDKLETVDFNSEHRARYRTRSLMSLYRAHENVVSEFINADGFGFSRSARMPARRRYIDIPDPPVVPQSVPRPQVEPSPDAATPPPLAENETQQAPVPQQESLDSLHADGVADFVNPGRFGYVADIDHVIGFIPHAFSTLPQLPGKLPADKPEPTRWNIATLELVSLLKHSLPVVYESENLPNMEQLDDVETRELDHFESDSLEKLRKGEDVVVDSGDREIRMLGSLRALRQCQQCHSVARGELLGAFTYRILRDPAVAKPAAPRSEVPAY